MTTYTIDADNNITAHAELPAGADQAFASEKDFAKLSADWPASRLVDTWNNFAGVVPFDDLKPVTKFRDRKAATGRIWKAVQRLNAPVAPTSAPEGPKKVRAKKPPVKAGGRAKAKQGGTGAPPPRGQQEGRGPRTARAQAGGQARRNHEGHRVATPHGARLHLHHFQEGGDQDRILEERGRRPGLPHHQVKRNLRARTGRLETGGFSTLSLLPTLHSPAIGVMNDGAMPSTTKAAQYRDLAIFRSGRSLALDGLAREQAVLNAENETDMTDEDAARLNADSFRDRGERNFFKNQYRRHARTSRTTIASTSKGRHAPPP